MEYAPSLRIGIGCECADRVVYWITEPIIRLTLKRRDRCSGQMCRHALSCSSSSTAQAPNLIMHVRSKSKGVDTVRARSLAEVRKPNHGLT
jgi:hypothetical protein